MPLGRFCTIWMPSCETELSKLGGGTFSVSHLAASILPLTVHAVCTHGAYSTQIRLRASVSAAARCLTSAVMKGMVRLEAAWNVSADATCRASMVLSPVFWTNCSTWLSTIGPTSTNSQ